MNVAGLVESAVSNGGALQADPGALQEARTQLQREPASAILGFLQFAYRARAAQVQVSLRARQLSLRAVCGCDPGVSEAELLRWARWLQAMDASGWVAASHEENLLALSWQGEEMRFGLEPFPSHVLEFRGELAERATPVLSHAADLEQLRLAQTSLQRLARFYPVPLYFNDVLWQYPLDFELVRVCSFSAYQLEREDAPGFAVAHPWAHGCRYWLTREGDVLDLVTLGARETADGPGNICHLPALGDPPQPQRRLGLMRRATDDGIDLSPPRTFAKSSYLPGHEAYLLSPRTVIFGTAQTRLQMRPLRVSELLLQTDESNGVNSVLPLRDGLLQETIFVPAPPGGLTVVSMAPAEGDLKSWAAERVARAGLLQKPLG